jgi:hypothetical protein
MTIGALTVFHDIAHQAAVPRTLPTARLTSGNGLLEASYAVAQMAGPALAGFAVQRAGLPATASITAGLFLAALLCLGPLRLAAEHGEETRRPLRAVARGLAFTWRSRPLRDLSVQSALFNLHEQAFMTAFMVWAVRSLHWSGGTIGLLLGLGSVGALAGSLWVGRRAGALHVGAAVSTSLTVCGLALLVGTALAPAVPSAVAVAVALLVNGAALAVYNVFVLSLRGALAPPEHMAVVMASYRLVAMAPVPLGALLGGVLVELVGAHTTLVAVAASMTTASLALRRSPVREIRRLDEGTDAGDGTDGGDGTDAGDGTDGGDGTDAGDGTDGGDATDGMGGAGGTVGVADSTSGPHGTDGSEPAHGGDPPGRGAHFAGGAGTKEQGGP